jgi:glycine cleavage system H protein
MYDFYIGITDLDQKEIGIIDPIELTIKEGLLKKGSTWGVVYGINEAFNLIAPFDCEIVERNNNLHVHTAYVNTAPYKYWFAILTTKTEAVSLLTFQVYTQLTQ